MSAARTRSTRFIPSSTTFTRRARLDQLFDDSLQQYARGRLSVSTAASGEIQDVDPLVNEALLEIEAEVEGSYSKPLTPEVLGAADVIVTMARSVGEISIPWAHAAPGLAGRRPRRRRPRGSAPNPGRHRPPRARADRRAGPSRPRLLAARVGRRLPKWEAPRRRASGRVRQASNATTSAIAATTLPKISKVDCRRDVRDDDAGEHGGHRQRGVGGDVERGQDRGAVLGRNRHDERAQAAEEGGAEAGAADDRAGEVRRARAGRGGERRSCIIPAARAIEPALAAIQGAVRAGQELGDRRRCGERDDADAGHDRVGRVEQVRRRAAGRARRRGRRSTRRRARRARRGRRAGGRRPGRWGARPSAGSRERSATGSGIKYAPAKAIATGRAGRGRAAAAAPSRSGRATTRRGSRARCRRPRRWRW